MLVVLAFVVVQLLRPVPAAQLRLAVPARMTLPGPALQLPWPTSGQAVVDVVGMGRLGSSGDGKSVPVASLSKIMTAYLVLEAHPLAAGQPGPTITVSQQEADSYSQRANRGQSLLPVQAGQQLSERQLIDALLIVSANNSAEILARWTAGSVDAFVRRMNDTAAHMQLRATHFVDSSGFEPGSVSNADDLVRLATTAMGNPTFAEVVAEPSVELPLLGRMPNYNLLLGHHGVIGVKTGTTRAAGGNVVFAARFPAGGRQLTLVGAVLSQQVGSDDTPALGAALVAADRLVTASEASLAQRTVFPAGATVATLHTDWGSDVPVRLASPIQLVGWPGMPLTVALTRRGSTQLLAVSSGDGQRDEAPLVGHADPPGPSLGWRLTRF